MAEERVPAIHPLLTSEKPRNREASKRKKHYVLTSVTPGAVDDYVNAGWAVDKKLKRKVRLRKSKPRDEKFEDRLWYLFHKLGFQELNQGRSCTILVERRGAEPLRKQVDVFARDEETVIVAECKASATPKRKSLQKDLEELGSLKGPIANTITRFYGKAFKPKILWLFATENIIWSPPDKARAEGHNIRIITERELRYYIQVAEHLGSAGRFQFLAEFFKNQPIPGLGKAKVPAIRGKLGRRKFYAFVATPRMLLKIAFVNHRSLNDPDGAPSYQRLISRTRMKQIGRFLGAGGFFPTNLLLNFIRPVRFDQSFRDDDADVAFGELYLPDRYQSAWVVDGQHRLYGFAHTEENHLDDNVIVVAFEKLPNEEEANLFVTINHEQKSVPKSLLDDLEGELKWGSHLPGERIGAIAARLIATLNTDLGEPFYNRVTQQGIPATSRVCLTVPALKDALRKSGLLGKSILKRRVFEAGPLSGASDSESLDRARSTLNTYFGLFRDNNATQWELGRDGYLCTNVAIQGYILLLSSLIEYMEANKGMQSRELSPAEIVMEIEEYVQPILVFLESADAAKMESRFKVQFGSGGPREYYFRLCDLVRTEFSDFTPEGFDDWEAERSDENIKIADQKLKELNVGVQSYIFDVFRSKWGPDNDIYWDKGVTDKNIKAAAYKKSLDDDIEKRLPLENYLDFIDYKKIVENKQNWPLFANVFDIPMPGEKGYSKNIRWMDRVNELRRIPAHPTKERHYRIEDFEFIEFVHEEFHRQLSAERNKGL